MKTLIFEGIVTSGKSKLTELIESTLTSGMTVEVASEGKTHEPIMYLRNSLNINFFKDVIQKMVKNNPDLLIFDRFYLTQAFRANANLSQYSEVEDMLMPYQPHTILLKVDESSIAKRIEQSANQRGKEWQDFWKTKGASYEQIAHSYIEQQKTLLELIKQSKLPYSIFDTTNNNYEEITQKIVEIIKN